ncbi:MAG: hypothetical protein KIT72_10015 [Polyangiaceae bacterium]|nr:hypothetical protein [Polyangiaceae bacterium]MCW5790745.1 hypothetical protein [Polyangiaceae bacterium]
MQGNTAAPTRSASEPEDDLILPVLPPLEADDEPSELLDPSELLQLSFDDAADDDEPEDFSHGIELPELMAGGDDEPDTALPLDDLGLIQLPLASSTDEEDDEALNVGELVELPAAEDPDDHEGPLEAWALDGAALPELAPDDDDDRELDLSEPLTEMEEELPGLWPARVLSERPVVAMSPDDQPTANHPSIARLGHRSFPMVALGSEYELLRSLDDGVSWCPIVSDAAPAAWLRSSDLKLHASGSLLALGSERHGLALSSDGGLSYTELSLTGVTALASGRPAGETMLLFVACYDPLLDEARIHAVDPLELESRVIGVIRPQDADLDLRVRDLHYSRRGLIAVGDFGAIQFEPPARRDDA